MHRVGSTALTDVGRCGQSYLWNCAASHRARRYCLDGAVTGDLVLEGDADVADAVADDADMCDDEMGAALHLSWWCFQSMEHAAGGCISFPAGLGTCPYVQQVQRPIMRFTRCRNNQYLCLALLSVLTGPLATASMAVLQYV